ncbi:MAG: hypothetical protein U0892_03120 [Pirellulales bacterium]
MRICPKVLRAIYERNKGVIGGSPYLKYLAAENSNCSIISEEAEAAAEEAFKLWRFTFHSARQKGGVGSGTAQKLVASFR